MARGTRTPAAHLLRARGLCPVKSVLGCPRPQWCFFIYFLLFLICSKPPTLPSAAIFSGCALLGCPGCLVSREAEAGTLRP